MSVADEAQTVDLSLGELRHRCETLKTSSHARPVGIRLKLAEELLQRAAAQRPAVQEKLLERVDSLLGTLEKEVAAGGDANTTPREENALASNISTQLSALTEALLPQAVVPDKAATGLAFDEYLRQQEDEALLMWAHHDADDVPRSVETAPDADVAPAEMRAARQLRELRLKRHADSLVELALAEAPEDPGPLNPQMLSIKALSHMRDLSPQYLNRFVSYVDTMIWLEKAFETQQPRTAKGKNRRRK